ncbi:MAG: hypothetical protein J6Z04_05345 [Clostridia bacterium]|nr:hypothetical protein [Clostridia bacterium]
MNEYRLTEEGRLERFSGRVLRRNGRVYVNPKQDVLRAAGYKPLVRDRLPADAGQNDERGVPVVYEAVYADEGDAIRLSYRRGAYSRDED